MLETMLRNAARRLMAFAIRICPTETRDWAEAMSAEIDYVEGPFSALAWSIGCVGIVLKRLWVSMFRVRATEPDAGSEGTMKKIAKVSAIVLAAASVLFVLAPTFRQGLKMAAGSWYHSESWWSGVLHGLGKEAEAKHDAEALAFVAMRIPKGQQRDKFADEAVEWDPRLTWIYYPLLSHDLMQQPGSADADSARWLARLQAWDPDNAAIYALEGSYSRPQENTRWNAKLDRNLLANSPQWLHAMDKAYSATSYDTYLSRRTVLDRDVMRRYRLVEPDEMLMGIMSYPLMQFSELNLYEKDFLLYTGDDFESKGDFKHAEANYWKAERMGELIQLRGDTDLEKAFATEMQLNAEPRLEAAFEKTGDFTAAKLLAYQIAVLRQARSRLAQNWQDTWSRESQSFDGSMVQLSLAAMGVSLLLVLCCGGYFAVRRLRSAKAGRLNPIFWRAGILGSVFLFISSVAMYFSYAPYAKALETYLADPDPARNRDALLRFWALQNMPSGLLDFFRTPHAKAYFWYAVIVLGTAVIAWILLRHVARLFHHDDPTPVIPNC